MPSCVTDWAISMTDPPKCPDTPLHSPEPEKVSPRPSEVVRDRNNGRSDPIPAAVVLGADISGGAAADARSATAVGANPLLNGDPMEEGTLSADSLRYAEAMLDLLVEVWSDPNMSADTQLAMGVSEAEARPGVCTRTIGRFEIKRPLGKGGFGIVWLARDPKLNRWVALKVPKPEALFLPGARARFLREARAAATLDHPNIVPVLEAAESGAIAYIAYAYCPGGSLAEWLERETAPTPIRSAVALVETLTRAVEHAHSRNVWHRDIKPENILLSPIESPRSPPGSKNQPDLANDVVPKLTDFGLAKIADDEASLSVSGTVIGTAEYMAPEQVGAKKSAIGPAADVYSLGAVLYELLTGRPPIQGENRAETLRLLIEYDPPSPRLLRRGIPKDLETICLKCLEKTPSRRYASAALLAEDLKRFLAGQPIQAQPALLATKVVKWVRRRPLVAALVAVVALSLASGMAGVLLHNASLGKALNLAEKHRLDTLEREAILKEHLYAADIRMAQQAIANGEVGRAEKVLARYEPGEGEKDLRGFEWRHLWHQCHAARLIYKGHAGNEVYTLTYSPDGKTIASGGAEGLVRLWDPDTGADRALLRSHTAEIACLEFSPDGRRLLSGSGDGAVMLWDVPSGKLLRAITAHRRPIRLVHFSLDGKKAWSLAQDGRIRSWDLQTGAPLEEIDIGSEIRAAESAAQTDIVAVACPLETHFLDLSRSGHRLRGPASSSLRHAIAPDGTTWAQGTDTKIMVDQMSPGKPSSLIEDIPSGIRCLKFSPDQRTLAGTFEKGQVSLWPIHGVGGGQKIYPGHVGKVFSVDFSPDGKNIASAGADGTVQIFSVADSAAVRSIAAEGTGRPLPFIGFLPGDETLAVPCMDRHFKLLSARTLAIESEQLLGSGTPLPCFVLLPTPGQVACAGDGGDIHFLDLPSGRQLAVFQGQSAAIDAMALAPDGGRFATGSRDRTAKIWDTRSLKLVATCAGHEGNVTTVQFMNHGRQLVTVAANQAIRAWDAKDGKPLACTNRAGRLVYIGASAKESTILFLEDGDIFSWEPLRESVPNRIGGLPGGGDRIKATEDLRHFAVVRDDGFVGIFDAKSLAMKHTIHETGPAARAFAFSSDGSLLAVILGNHSIEVVETATGNVRARLDGSSSPLAAGPDGLLAAAGSEGRIQVLEPVSGREIASWKASHSSRAVGLHFSAGGTRLGATHADGWITLHDVQSRREIRAIPAHDRGILCFAGDKDAARIATAGKESVKIWSLLDGSQEAELAEVGDADALAFAADGKMLYAANGTSIGQWSIAGGARISSFAGPSQAVTCLAASADGRWLAAGSSDRVVRLWRCTEPGSSTLIDCQRPIVALAFSRSGATLAIALANGAVRLWHTVAEQELLTLKVGELPVEHLTFISDDRMLVTSGPSRRYSSEITLFLAAPWNRPSKDY